MNQKHLTQIWQWLSIVCLLLLLSCVASIQGAPEFVVKLFGEKAADVQDNLPAVGYFGAIIGNVLFFTSSLALLLHARRYGDHWHERLPVVWLEGLNTSAWEGKLFQLVVAFILFVLPAAGIVKCTVVAEAGDICELDTKHVYKGSETTLLWPPVAQPGNQMRLRKGNSGQTDCKTGIEILPRVGTPLLIYGLALLSLCNGAAALVAVILGRR